MELTSLVPRDIKFNLTSIKDREFTMKAITLADKIWLDENFPNGQIAEIFLNINIKEICRIIFRLLTPEDKLFFKKQKVKIVNEEGDEEEIEIGGVALLQSLISGGIGEELELVNALLKNMGYSDNQIEDIKNGKLDEKPEENTEKKSPNQ
jgi:hypothetical protein